ncbi:MAG: methionyl-tRNA formyltransferase [Spirochaetales bacterium]|nr:methionyl-tRNA formyltransferase [Spirochaetales bacterium]
MRVFFAGTPEIAVPSLEKLAERHEVVGVLTNPDRECGRGREIKCCQVKMKADELGIQTFQPEKLDEAFIEEIRALEPEILAVTAYGQIFRKNFIDIFPYGGLNVHPSMLPKFRGASPIQSALLSGDDETGISIQRLALKMDSGAILAQEQYVYSSDDTAESLTVYFAKRGAELLAEVVDKVEAGTAVETQQDESAVSYCSYITKDDGLIDWTEPASAIDRRLRAFTPWPGVYTFFSGKKLNILEAELYPQEDAEGECGKVIRVDKKAGILIQTGRGILAVRMLQLQSKKALDWKSFTNGVKDFTDAVLGG